ncbi:MAG: hypothetical protein FWE25_04345 [Lachnospiraceae bacterium]|nr:hypothetical protein [Lachnospiraceae bacterium]
MKHKILLAVDAGGTKTEYCIKFLSDGKVSRYLYGGSNYKSVGLEATQANLIESFLEICRKENIRPSEVQRAVFGISGCDSEQDIQVYNQMISRTGLHDKRISLYNDCELAFQATTDAPGLCVVAGTGSNCMAFQVDKPIERAGGWGAFLSDGGSGYWIARYILEEMLLFSDGIGSNRAIYEKIACHFHIKNQLDIAACFTALSVSEIASVARVILDCAKDGDTYAQEVLHLAHVQLWNLAIALVKRMKYKQDEVLDVVLNGSLFRNTWFLENFWQGLVRQIENPLRQHLVATNTTENAMRMAHKLYDIENKQT